jgi:cob(I)alamin adenosyltransferase
MEFNFNTIITKGGDEGFTSVGSAGRMSKGSGLPSILGELDELQVRIGWGIFHARRDEDFLYSEGDINGYQRLGILQDISLQGNAISKKLWKFMGGLSFPEQEHPKPNLQQLEEWCEDLLPTEPPREFSIPGLRDDLIAMSAHSVRTQARKVERELVGMLLPSDYPFSQEMTDLLREWLPWFNRLSDYYYLITLL